MVTQELIQKVSLKKLKINGNIGINSKSVSDISVYFFLVKIFKYVADNILRQQCTYQTGQEASVLHERSNHAN